MTQSEETLDGKARKILNRNWKPFGEDFKGFMC